MSGVALLLLSQRRYLEAKTKLLRSKKCSPKTNRMFKKEISVIHEKNSK